MKDKIIISGSGGQGIQFAGQVLALAAVGQGLEATYVPSYGAERRGGLSFCTVVLSDQSIYSPTFRQADVLLALDQRARNLYGGQIGPQGLILANQILAGQPGAREAARVHLIPGLGVEPSAFNMLMLGAYVGLGRSVSLEQAETVLRSKSSKKPHLLEGNLASLRRGAEWGRGAAH